MTGLCGMCVYENVCEFERVWYVCLESMLSECGKVCVNVCGMSVWECIMCGVHDCFVSCCVIVCECVCE